MYVVFVMHLKNVYAYLLCVYCISQTNLILPLPIYAYILIFLDITKVITIKIT